MAVFANTPPQIGRQNEHTGANSIVKRESKTPPPCGIGRFNFHFSDIILFRATRSPVNYKSTTESGKMKIETTDSAGGRGF